MTTEQRKPMSKVTKEKPQIIDESGDKYKSGFVTAIEADTAPKGLNEDIIRLISAKKGEPEWLLEWRLKAFDFWKTMKEPHWAKASGSSECHFSVRVKSPVFSV